MNTFRSLCEAAGRRRAYPRFAPPTRVRRCTFWFSRPDRSAARQNVQRGADPSYAEHGAVRGRMLRTSRIASALWRAAGTRCTREGRPHASWPVTVQVTCRTRQGAPCAFARAPERVPRAPRRAPCPPLICAICVAVRVGAVLRRACDGGHIGGSAPRGAFEIYLGLCRDDREVPRAPGRRGASWDGGWPVPGGAGACVFLSWCAYVEVLMRRGAA